MAKNQRTPADSGAPGRYSNLSTNKQADPSWYAADSGQLGDAVLNVARLGDAILIAATSDGGALKLLILAGDQKIPHYVVAAADVDALTDLLAKLHE